MGVIICLARKPMSSAETAASTEKTEKRSALSSEADLTFVSRRIQSTRPGRPKILSCVVDYQNPVQILSLKWRNHLH